MQYTNVCLESFGYTLPAEAVSTSEIEVRLAPLYDRLRMPQGRLELMSGISARRFWPKGMPPSVQSIESCRLAIEAAGIATEDIGALMHGSVCRDFLEPATAAGVHHAVGLPSECMIYDVSNACLGLLNGIVQAANMIELGQIKAALVVGTESGRDLVENTIASLNRDESLTRRTVKNAVASLTIGSGSCAVLVTHADISCTGNRLRTAVWRAETSHHQLCQSGRDEAADLGVAPLMHTDSETLMREGIATGVSTYRRFLDEADWSPDQLNRTFCHQVGGTHRKAMLDSLDLDPSNDFATLEWLGNTGSVALPVTMAIGLERGFVEPGQYVGMLGIGSGINCLMLAVEWQKTLVAGRDLSLESQQIAEPIANMA